MLRGRVTDPDGAGIAAVLVRSGEHEATTDDSGAFTLVAPLPGPISATRSAWEGAEEEWDGSRRDFEIVLEPFVVRGIRVTGVAAGSPTDFAGLLDMIEGTVVNTLVFDTKDEDGAVHYDVPGPRRPGERSGPGHLRRGDRPRRRPGARPVHHHPHRHLPGPQVGPGQPGARRPQHRHRRAHGSTTAAWPGPTPPTGKPGSTRWPWPSRPAGSGSTRSSSTTCASPATATSRCSATTRTSTTTGGWPRSAPS